MKKQIKFAITYLLILSLLVTSILSMDFCNVKAETNVTGNTTEEMEISEGEDEYIENEVELSYKITSQWDKHYNLDVTLKNLTDKNLDDWEIRIPANFKIENIWNANITDEQDGEYMIHNAEWNQDIPAEGSVSFGMTILGDEKPELPQYCEMVRIRLGVCEEYDVVYTEYSHWDNHVNGKITITNNSQRTMEDWSLLLECNFEIENIWNAKITESFELEDGELEGFSYDLENVVNNQNIKPGESVDFGFIAKCENEVNLFSNRLYEMIEDDDEINYDYEEEEDYDELVWDEDAFETSEEYIEYINGVYNESESSNVYGLRRSVASVSNAISPLKGIKKDTIELGEDAKPIQNYLPVGNELYTLHHSLKNKNDAFLKKRKADSSFSDDTLMRGFAHGQTFEQVTYKKKEYYLLAGKASGEFAKNIVFMKRDRFEELFSKKNLNFNDWTKSNPTFTVLCGLEYSNEKAKKWGKITRTDAALTADGKVLVIWKQLYNEKKSSHISEISLYNMDKVNRYLLKEKDQTMKGKLNFNGKYKEKLKEACIGSVNEIYKLKTDNSNRILQPNGSFQSIDVEWNGKNKLQVYITSGNENKKQNPHTKYSASKKLTIMYLDCEVKNEKLVKSIAYRNLITCDKSDMGETINQNSTLEVEGCHVIGNSLDYVIVPSGKVDKGTQFIYTLPLSSLQGSESKEKELKLGTTNQNNSR